MAPDDLRARLQPHSLREILSRVPCRFKEVEKLPFFLVKGAAMSHCEGPWTKGIVIYLHRERHIIIKLPH